MAELTSNQQKKLCSGKCGPHHKATPRSEKELRQLQNRLKRMIGQ